MIENPYSYRNFLLSEKEKYERKIKLYEKRLEETKSKLIYLNKAIQEQEAKK